MSMYSSTSSAASKAKLYEMLHKALAVTARLPVPGRPSEPAEKVKRQAAPPAATPTKRRRTAAKKPAVKAKARKR